MDVSRGVTTVADFAGMVSGLSDDDLERLAEAVAREQAVRERQALARVRMSQELFMPRGRLDYVTTRG